MQSETAPTTTPAPAAPVLTIDTLQWELQELREVRAAIDWAEKATDHAGRDLGHILTAGVVLRQGEERLVKNIKVQGGLLLIGGPK